MAFIGNCTRHGQYCDTCHECINEEPLLDLVKRIKAGVDPDTALEQVLHEKDDAKRQARIDEMRKRLEKQSRMLARNAAIDRFLDQHPELKDDEMRY